MAAEVFPQKVEGGVGLDSVAGQPGQGTCSYAGILQPVQSCPTVASGAVLKENLDVEVQSWLYSSYSVYETFVLPQDLKKNQTATEIWEAPCSSCW